jgi:hypothetical protein
LSVSAAEDTETTSAEFHVIDTRRSVNMLIIMKKHAPDDTLDQIKEYLISRDFDIHQSTGANRTIIGVIGDTDALNVQEIEAMPGVSQVVRIKKDD